MAFSSAPAKDLFLVAPLALLVATGSASASRPSPPATAETHFVWRVTNLATPFYLVGSIHNLTEEDYPLPPIYHAALTNSRRVVFEYNPRQREALARKFGEAYQAKYDFDMEEFNEPFYAVQPKTVFGFTTADDQFTRTATRWMFD